MDWPFAPLEPGGYGAIMADCPWAFKSYTALQSQNWHVRRDAAKHYPTMSYENLAALPVRKLAAPDCHLFMWTTGAHLPQAIDLMRAWGFKFSGVAFTWVKLKKRFSSTQLRFLPTAECDLYWGLGLTTRKGSEVCLLSRRGNARRKAKNVREVIMAPVREHSRKPDEAYARVQRYCDGPYADLFSREDRPGWSAWGFETGKFNGNDWKDTEIQRGELQGRQIWQPSGDRRGAAKGAPSTVDHAL